MNSFKNWNESSKCEPSRVVFPNSEDDVRQMIVKAKGAGKRIRVVGNAVCSFGDISMCDDGDYILNMKKYNQLVDFNQEKKTVTAQAGMSLADLINILKRNEAHLALRNMGDCTKESLGGLMGTG
ncbi:MAG: FAD-binding protein, partial [Gaiellaceae bacterium]